MLFRFLLTFFSYTVDTVAFIVLFPQHFFHAVVYNPPFFIVKLSQSFSFVTPSTFNSSPVPSDALAVLKRLREHVDKNQEAYLIYASV